MIRFDPAMLEALRCCAAGVLGGAATIQLATSLHVTAAAKLGPAAAPCSSPMKHKVGNNIVMGCNVILLLLVLCGWHLGIRWSTGAC